MEREKGRERIRVQCEYKKESYQKVVVQISFLIVLWHQLLLYRKFTASH